MVLGVSLCKSAVAVDGFVVTLAAFQGYVGHGFYLGVQSWSNRLVQVVRVFKYSKITGHP